MNKTCTAITVSVAWAVNLYAADWPMWRYDAARSAATPTGLSSNLTLLWSRKLPPVRPAWPLDPQQRVNFDASYEPVVMGKLMFLASPNDGSITAYQTETGVEAWKFYTGGPVRCAPACWNGRIYVGSDDGHLYCLAADSGKLLWKFRAAPADRPDRKLLGNGHLVSFWPVRGGPVVRDGTVCFGSGVWSIFGVFLYGLDAVTGAVKWENSKLNYIARVRIDHELFEDEGLSPQGYLVAVNDRLLVPSGRSLPAGLEFDTGNLLYYVRGFHSGDSRVAAHGDYAFAGKEAVINTYDFREIGSRWAYSGTNAPTGYKAGFGNNHVGNPDKNSLGEAPWVPYKYIEACDAASAFTDGKAHGLANGVFYAYNLKAARHIQKEQTIRGKKIPMWSWEPALLWQLKAAPPGSGRAVIVAGERLYGGAGRTLVAIDRLQVAPRVVWTQAVAGMVSSLSAADNKLFAATEEGWIHCFGEAAGSRTATVFDLKPVPLAAGTDPVAEKAGTLIPKVTGVTSGYGLVLGLTDGRLFEELLKQKDLTLIGVDPDAAKIESLRRRLDAAGHLGTRAQLFVGKPFEFPFPPYLASLITSEDALASGFSVGLDPARLFQTLRPYGGTLCLDLSPDMAGPFKTWAARAGAVNAKTRREGDWQLLTREGALPGAAPWSHDAADAARTFCSQDDLVRAPLGVLWYGDMTGFSIWKAGTRPQVAGGRVFVPKPRSRGTQILAYDAYTGRFLWGNDTKATTTGGPMVVMPDGVYLALDGQCRVYDPETGAFRNSYVFSPTGTMATRVLSLNDSIIVIAGSRIQGPKNEFTRLQDARDSSTLVCLNRATGAELWRREASNRFSNSSIVLGAGLVYSVDSIPTASAGREEWKHIDSLKECQSVLLALEARTGRLVWSKSLTYPQTQQEGVEDWLACSTETGVLVGGRLNRAHAWEANTGRPLWSDHTVGHLPTIVHGRTFLSYFGHPVAREYDLLTGEPTARPIKAAKGGCNFTIGGRHLTVVRDCSVSYYDLEDGKDYRLRNTRSGCNNGLIQADGLVNAPSMATGCRCSYSFFTSFALTHMPEVDQWSGTTPVVMTPPPAKPERVWKPEPAREQP
jgi:outer membrane protein assembly factor BamB